MSIGTASWSLVQALSGQQVALVAMAKQPTKFVAKGSAADQATKFVAKGSAADQAKAKGSAAKQTTFVAKGSASKQTTFVAKGSAVKQTKFVAKGCVAEHLHKLAKSNERGGQVVKKLQPRGSIAFMYAARAS